MQEPHDLIDTAQAARMLGLTRARALNLLKKHPDATRYRCPRNSSISAHWSRAVVERIAEDLQFERETAAMCMTDADAARELDVPLNKVVRVLKLYDVQPYREASGSRCRLWQPRHIAQVRRKLERVRAEYASTADLSMRWGVSAETVLDHMHLSGAAPLRAGELFGFGSGHMWREQDVERAGRPGADALPDDLITVSAAAERFNINRFTLRRALLDADVRGTLHYHHGRERIAYRLEDVQRVALRKLERMEREKATRELRASLLDPATAARRLGVPAKRLEWCAEQLLGVTPEPEWSGQWPRSVVDRLGRALQQARAPWVTTPDAADRLGLERDASARLRKKGLTPAQGEECFWLGYSECGLAWRREDVERLEQFKLMRERRHADQT